MPEALLKKHHDQKQLFSLDSMEVEEFTHLLAIARYVQEVESYIVAKAIVNAFSNSEE